MALEGAPVLALQLPILLMIFEEAFEGNRSFPSSDVFWERSPHAPGALCTALRDVIGT